MFFNIHVKNIKEQCRGKVLGTKSRHWDRFPKLGIDCEEFISYLFMYMYV